MDRNVGFSDTSKYNLKLISCRFVPLSSIIIHYHPFSRSIPLYMYIFPSNILFLCWLKQPFRDTPNQQTLQNRATHHHLRRCWRWRRRRRRPAAVASGCRGPSFAGLPTWREPKSWRFWWNIATVSNPQKDRKGSFFLQFLFSRIWFDLFACGKNKPERLLVKLLQWCWLLNPLESLEWSGRRPLLGTWQIDLIGFVWRRAPRLSNHANFITFKVYPIIQ